MQHIRIIGIASALALLLAAIVLGRDWRLYQRFYSMPADIAEPAVALWYEPRVAIGDGPGAAIPTAASGELKLPADALEAAWAYAEKMETDALIVAYDGEIQLERYGEGVNRDTLFQSQSLHKGLTATALGAAIHSGAIPTADTLAVSYLPEWRSDPNKAQVTLADLAYMQAGIERPRYAQHPFSPGAQLFFTSRLEERALNTQAVAAPRRTFIWSNASTQALAIAVERAVNRPWAEFLRESLWAPLGNGEAYVQLDRSAGTAQAFCCLVSNARNWLRVGELLRNEGRAGDQQLVPPNWVRAMTTGGVTNPNYGMQLWLNEPYTGDFLLNGMPELKKKRSAPLAARDAFYIEGHFAQRLHVVPSAGLVVVRFGADRLDWDDALLMNGLIKAAQHRRRPQGLPPVPPPPFSFGERPHPEAPDYTFLDDWAAHPDKFDASDNDPPTESRLSEPLADGFYIYPTTYRGQTWNADLDDSAVNVGVDDVVLGQSTVLGDCCRIFAPRYRQAAAASVYDRTGSGMKAYGLAFEDVRDAFKLFASQSERPFVILGHSQGGFHAQRLLTEEIAGTDLVERLVVAYVVGIAVPEAFIESQWSGIDSCATPEGTGCVAGWSTFGPGADGDAYLAIQKQRFPQYFDNDSVRLLCVNPLTGEPGAAAPETNLGAVPLPDSGGYLEAPLSALVGAACDRGMLRLTDVPGDPFSALALDGENYHFYDVALFYSNLRGDATRRVAEWNKKNEP